MPAFVVLTACCLSRYIFCHLFSGTFISFMSLQQVPLTQGEARRRRGDENGKGYSPPQPTSGSEETL